jgi:hypothetical protein
MSAHFAKVIRRYLAIIVFIHNLTKKKLLLLVMTKTLQFGIKVNVILNKAHFF